MLADNLDKDITDQVETMENCGTKCCLITHYITLPYYFSDLCEKLYCFNIFSTKSLFWIPDTSRLPAHIWNCWKLIRSVKE